MVAVVPADGARPEVRLIYERDAHGAGFADFRWVEAFGRVVLTAVRL